LRLVCVKPIDRPSDSKKVKSDFIVKKKGHRSDLFEEVKYYLP
jgi:hypothetical protein